MKATFSVASVGTVAKAGPDTPDRSPSKWVYYALRKGIVTTHGATPSIAPADSTAVAGAGAPTVNTSITDCSSSS